MGKVSARPFGGELIVAGAASCGTLDNPSRHLENQRVFLIPAEPTAHHTSPGSKVSRRKKLREYPQNISQLTVQTSDLCRIYEIGLLLEHFVCTSSRDCASVRFIAGLFAGIVGLKTKTGRAPMGAKCSRCVLVIFLLAQLHAQSTNASLTGRITDPNKAVITSAMVTVINTGTGIHYRGMTNETGQYYVSNLPPGRYRIEVEKLGFKAVIQSGLILHVQDALEVNFEMTLGSASESVTVKGEFSPIDAESSSVGTVVEQRKANELPLNGRNVFNLIVLAPSVVPQGSSTGTPIGVNPFGWGNYQVSGSFGNQSAQYLDGQPLNIGYINLPVLIPTQDSIQEFKVQTSNLGAEWGHFAGGVTNLSTKGGTNRLHGEAHEYLRNRIFNANDFFLNAAGKPRPPWVQNQFGVDAGGPLRLPHYNGRNRTFWFGSWESFRLRIGQPYTATVPTAEERAGDFSLIATPILDPCAGAVNSQGACPH